MKFFKKKKIKSSSASFVKLVAHLPLSKNNFSILSYILSCIVLDFQSYCNQFLTWKIIGAVERVLKKSSMNWKGNKFWHLFENTFLSFWRKENPTVS